MAAKTITVTLDASDAIHSAEYLRRTSEAVYHRTADVLISAVRPGPDSVDLDGRFDSRSDAIRYIGIARRQDTGLYRALADVGGALCTVEVSLVFDPAAEHALPAVKIGSDAPSPIAPTVLENAAETYARACEIEHAAAMICDYCEDDDRCPTHAPLHEETRRARGRLLDAARETKRKA